MALSLEKLIQKDVESLNLLQNHLEVDGWVFVELDSSTISQLSQVAPQLLQFFDHTPSFVKFKHTENVVGGVETDGPVYGYNLDAPRKEGLRLLTNSRLSPRWIPDSCSSLPSFSATLHQVMFQLISSVSPHLFSCSAEEVGRKWGVPMLRGEGHPKGEMKGPGGGRFGMLDVAYYFNSDSFKLPNCQEHSDPGLLSLSVVSTVRGLQMFRRKTGEWVDAPTGVGNSTAVLWGGTLLETITGGRLKSGIHRVINSPNSPRMSLWIECITEDQDIALTAPLLKKQPTSNQSSALSEKFPFRKLPPNNNHNNNHNDNKLVSLVSSSKRTGIPVSKSSGMTPFRQPQLQEPPTKLPKTPLPGRPGQFQKHCTPKQFEEMQEHTRWCNEPSCHSVWRGMWGPFIGGRDGDVNFSLSHCSRARWMNETIGWDYKNPAC